MSKYDDILRLPHHTSERHPRMSMENRAAQFAPFSALTGLHESIDEVARLTLPKKMLSESESIHISRKLQFILDNISRRLIVTFTVFQHDGFKNGGKDVTVRGVVWKYDADQNTLILEDNRRIAIPDIMDISLYRRK